MHPRWSSCWKAGALTSLLTLLTFGVAHVAFITPLVSRQAGVPLALLLLVMLGAPMMVGAVMMLVGTPLAVVAWRAARSRGRLASWRFGAALALGLVPAALFGVAYAGDGVPAPDPDATDEQGFDETGPPLDLTLAIGALQLAIPATFGVHAAGWRGLLLPLAMLPWSLGLMMFYLSTPLWGWAGLFVLGTLGAVTASGWWMERLVARFEARAARRTALAPAPAAG